MTQFLLGCSRRYEKNDEPPGPADVSRSFANLSIPDEMNLSRPADEPGKRIDATAVSSPESFSEIHLSEPWPYQANQTRQSMKRFGGNFRQLAWTDRLNLVVATLLGAALVLVLSPFLLLLWICVQLARRVSKRSETRD